MSWRELSFLRGANPLYKQAQPSSCPVGIQMSP